MDDLPGLQKGHSFLTSHMGLYKENVKFLSSYLAFLGYTASMTLTPHPIALLLQIFSYHRSLTRSWHHLCEVEMGENFFF